jgi:hypothetical protein
MTTAPRLEANCTRHGAPLAMCDHCANIHVMAQWAGSLSGRELAAALGQIAEGDRYYAPSERRAVLAEAGRRILSATAPDHDPGPPELAHGIMPLPGSVQDSQGVPCDRAFVYSYPLSALCSQCHGQVQAMRTDSPWVHAEVLPQWMRTTRGE